MWGGGGCQVIPVFLDMPNDKRFVNLNCLHGIVQWCRHIKELLVQNVLLILSHNHTWNNSGVFAHNEFHR